MAVVTIEKNTHQALKIEAAKRGITISELAEEKLGHKKSLDQTLEVEQEENKKKSQ